MKATRNAKESKREKEKRERKGTKGAQREGETRREVCEARRRRRVVSDAEADGTIATYARV